jgi:hypothetical protein
VESSLVLATVVEEVVEEMEEEVWVDAVVVDAVADF